MSLPCTTNTIPPPSAVKYHQKPKLAELHRQEGLKLHKSVLISTKKNYSKNEDNLNNEEELKEEEDLKNEDNLKYKDDLKKRQPQK